MGLARFIPSRIRDVLDPYRDLTYNVQAYGALGDGSQDDTTYIQAAIDAAVAAGGGVVYFPLTSSFYKLNGTLALDGYNRIILRGEVTKRNQYSSVLGGVYLKRVSGTGTMVHWAATSTTSLFGWGIQDLSFDGNSLAATGMYLSDQYGGFIQNVEVRGCTTVCVDLYGGAVGTVGWQANTVDGLSIRARDSGAIGMRWGSLTPFTGNVSLNTFKNVFIYHTDGATGLDVGDADSNYGYGFLIQADTHTAQAGVLLRASNTTDARHARNNIFFGIQPTSGVSAQGTGSGTQPAVNNAMYVSSANGVPDPAIGAGATLSWILDKQNWPLKGVGTKTADYTAVAGELVLCNTSGGGFTVTLPDTPPLGTLIGVLLDTAGNTLTIATAGGNTIFPGGSTSTTMASTGENALLEYVGANHWFTVGRGFGGTVANSGLANMAAKTVKMRHTNSTGAPEDATMANLWADLSAQAAADVDMNAHKLTNGTAGVSATDFATLSNRLNQFSIPNGDVDLNTNKLTRLAAATATGDAVRYEQVLPWTLFGALKDVQVFTANGTWNKPGTGTYACVYIKGAGGGGGGGSAGVSGTSRSGGGGGGSAGYVGFAIPLAALGSTAAVTVGTGGAGGTAGNAGSNGSSITQFDTATTGNCTTPASVTAGGGGGAGGTGTSSAGTAGAATAPVYTNGATKYGSAAVATNGAVGGTCAAGAAGAAGTVGSGGAGGGFSSAGPTFKAGGAGDATQHTLNANGQAGGADSYAGQPPLMPVSGPHGLNFAGGGGGGAGSVAVGGGRGGDAVGGGGGGGGGSCITGNGTAGTGGTGGNGIVVVLVY